MSYKELYEYQDEGFIKHAGIQVTDIQDGYAKGEIEIKPEHINPIGSVHGGVMFTIADTIGGMAAVSVGKKCTTVRGDINYLNPAINIEKLVAKALVIKSGKRMIIVEVTIEDQNEKMLSKAMLTYFVIGENGKAV